MFPKIKISLFIALLSASVISFSATPTASATKKGYRFKVDSSRSEESDEYVKGSFMVASQCPDCNHGYRLDQVTFSGFDKPRNSSTETFFITNNTDKTLTGVNIYIDYRTPDGRQLHKRFYPLRCNIPPGETRQAQLKSWDIQHTFVYVKSMDTGRKQGTPFEVIFDPVAYYLRYD